MNVDFLLNQIGKFFMKFQFPRQSYTREVTTVTDADREEKECLCDLDKNCMQQIVRNCDIIYVFSRNELLGYLYKGRFHRFEPSEIQRRVRSYDIDYYQVEYTEKFPLQEEEVESSDDSSGGYYYYLITLSFAAVSFYMGASAASNSSNPFQWNFQPSWVGGSLAASLGALTPAGIGASFTFLTGTMGMPGMVAGIVIITISAGYGYLCAASTGNDWNYRNWNMSNPVMQNSLFGGVMFGSAFWAGIGSVETSFVGATGAARIVFIIVVISGTIGTAYYAAAVSRGNVRFWEWNWRNPKVIWKAAYGGTFGLAMAIPVYSLGALWPQLMEEMREADKSSQLHGDQYVWSDKNNTINSNATYAQMYSLVETIFISGALFEATEIHPLLNYLPSSASTTVPLLEEFVHKIYNNFENLLHTPPITPNMSQELAFPKLNQKPHYLLPNCYHHLSTQSDQSPVTRCIGQNFLYTIHPKSSSAGLLTEDHYSYCSPIEFSGRPSVVCEGESSTLIFTPQLTGTLLDHLDGVLMLALAAPAVFRSLRSLVERCIGMFSGKVHKEVPPDVRDVALIRDKFDRLSRKVRKAQLVDPRSTDWTANIMEDLQEDILRFSKNAKSNELDNLLDRLNAVEEELMETINSTPSVTSSVEFVTPIKAFVKGNNIKLDLNVSGFESTDSPLVRPQRYID